MATIDTTPISSISVRNLWEDVPLADDVVSAPDRMSLAIAAVSVGDGHCKLEFVLKDGTRYTATLERLQRDGNDGRYLSVYGMVSIPLTPGSTTKLRRPYWAYYGNTLPDGRDTIQLRLGESGKKYRHRYGESYS